MCQFCPSDQATKEDIKQGLLFLSGRLEKLASHMRDMAFGKIEPHTKEASAITPTAHLIIRALVDDWM